MINYIEFANTLMNTYVKDYIDVSKLQIINVSVRDAETAISTIDIECLYNDKKEFCRLTYFKENGIILEYDFALLFSCFSHDEIREISKEVNEKLNRKDA